MSTLSLDIELERASFTVGVKLDVPLTGITALFGPSGSGKTTLLRIVAGLERATRGRVAFDGESWQDDSSFVPAHRRRIGYVFQDGRLFSHLTVEGNLMFALDRAATKGPLGLPDAVDALDLRTLLPRRPQSLSGGEQQRVAIARALLASPRLLLMDEPLSSLDAARKREIVPHIESLPARFGVPVLYVTHNVDEVVRLASDVVLLAGGRVAAHGRVADVLERLDLAPLAEGLEPGAVLRGSVVAYDSGVATVRVGTQDLRIPMGATPIGSQHNLRVFASDVAIATARPERLSIRNVLDARILTIEAGSGPNVELLLEIDGQHLRSRITREAMAELGLAEGRPVFALIKSVALESSLSP